MEPEGSLPYSQVPATCPYPEPAKSEYRSEAYCLTVLQPDTFLRSGVVSTLPNPQAGGRPLVGFPRLLIQYIRSYPPYRRPFLHPQPEDAPCHGDRDPLITVSLLTRKKIMWPARVWISGHVASQLLKTLGLPCTARWQLVSAFAVVRHNIIYQKI
jgi:hypothetical protein